MHCFFCTICERKSGLYIGTTVDGGNPAPVDR